MYHILYVDDEAEFCEIVKLFLEDKGNFSVDTYTSAVKALGHLVSVQYDAIVSDYQMPGMNGITFLTTLRDRGDITPFVIFTGKGREDVVIDALNSGADFYLQKGGDPEPQFTELEYKILHAISRRRTYAALRESEEKFRSLVDYGLEGVFILDLQGTILFANRAAARTLECDTCEGLVGRNVKEFVAPESLGDVRNDFEQVASGHDGYLARYQVITAKGNRIYLESIGKVITYEGKTADLVSIRDITSATPR
jgi:PAS domain S-box-containing protein